MLDNPTEILGIVIDIGLGTLAYRLARQLERVVTSLEAAIKVHGTRLDKLEEMVMRND